MKLPYGLADYRSLIRDGREDRIEGRPEARSAGSGRSGKRMPEQPGAICVVNSPALYFSAVHDTL